MPATADIADDVPGLYRRRIDLCRWEAGTVVGWLEDDFHHFGVTIVHDGSRVTDVRSIAVRAPWTTCPGASRPLMSLIGKPLQRRASAIGGLIEMRLQCTHMFDLAGLLLAHAGRSDRHRFYEAQIPDAACQGDHTPRVARLSQGGDEVLTWMTDGRDILEGGRRVPLGRGFREWTEGMPPEAAEHAIVLRRAVFVSGGRGIETGTMTPDGPHTPAGAVCHTLQPGRRAQARWIDGGTRDYANGDGMLSQLGRIP